MPAGAVIVAAGTGSRMGRPKQFLPLRGRPMLDWTLETFLGMAEFERLVVVLAPETLREHGDRLRSERVRVVEGGLTRMGSVRNGLSALGPEIDLVAVHDGARPLVSREVALACLKAAAETGAALPGVPVKDTLKEVRSPQLWVHATPERSAYWLAQTPQCYRRSVLEGALEKFSDDKDATDESQLVERAGHRVRVVPSTYENIKVTTPEDLAVAGAFLDSRWGAARRESRTGFGFDIHRLVEGRPLWLAGLRLAHPKGLLGHSDGDVVLHAACDAVLGASGLGEIGQMFPPEDPTIKGIESRRIVARVLENIASKNLELLHLDITLVAEEPKLKPQYAALIESLQSLWRLSAGRVNLKAKSHEGLGEIGRGEAIACYAVATVAFP